jgi:ABC-type dipeptide/oligopeptide/nickel transport system ATPase component
VTHRLGVVAKICDRLSVLYAGWWWSDTSVEDFFAAPAHAYSAALLAATPRHDAPESSLHARAAGTWIDAVRGQWPRSMRPGFPPQGRRHG